MLSAAKVIVPVLLVRFTAAPVELVTLVVPVTDRLPAAAFTVMPVLALLVEEMLWKMASSVPVLRLSA